MNLIDEETLTKLTQLRLNAFWATCFLQLERLAAQPFVSRDMANAFGLGAKHNITFSGGLELRAGVACVFCGQSSVDRLLLLLLPFF
mmetsp:Transcript_90322/g.173845  ORF Transcript_90322/g.173845 Transcript_90322/m.173845 type:complete len:87 (-) Transcript_90322:232-492(-)